MSGRAPPFDGAVTGPSEEAPDPVRPAVAGAGRRGIPPDAPSSGAPGKVRKRHGTPEAPRARLLDAGARLVVVSGRRDAAGGGGAIRETLERTHAERAPRRVVRADVGRRARIAVIRTILDPTPPRGRDEAPAVPPGPRIAGGPGIRDA